jgi:hypothetical protein
MIRILMLDVGNTLIREADQTLFPHVLSALETIQSFTTAAGGRLDRCLVSNFPPNLPVPAEQVAVVLQTFLSLLPVSLAAHFEPADRLVTLSAHAGVALPDPRVFTKAIERFGVQAGLDECLFVTGEADHLSACRRVGMDTLRFGGHQSPPPPGSDFSDWLDAPGLIARRLDPVGRANLEAAVRGRLAIMDPQLEKVKVEPTPDPQALCVRAQRWVPLDDPTLGELNGVHVQLPVQFEFRLDAQGKPIAAGEASPSAADLAEAAEMVRGLRASGQVATPTGRAPGAPTHQVETDSQGRRYLKRKRFTQW